MSMVDSIKDKTNLAVSYAGEFHELAANKVEQAIDLHIATFDYFGKVAVRQLRMLNTLHEQDSLQKLAADSVSLSGELAKRVWDDSSAWLSLTIDFTKQACGIIRRDSVDVGKLTDIKAIAV
jgi:hypothetical protein